MSTNPFAPKATEDTIQTGVQGSVVADLEAMAAAAGMKDDSPTELLSGGYASYSVSSVTKKDGSVVAGIVCDVGFYYPDAMGEEVIEILADYAKRGFAYELGADSQ